MMSGPTGYGTCGAELYFPGRQSLISDVERNGEKKFFT